MNARKAFDPVTAKAALIEQVSKLETGIIHIASPYGGCQVRADYIGKLLGIVHAHLIEMTDDVRGNINVNMDAIQNAVDQLNEIGDIVTAQIEARIELERP